MLVICELGIKRMVSKSVNRLNKNVLALAVSITIGLAGCSGGGSGGGTPPAPGSQSVSGGGVKGPLANAVVTVYAFDGTQADFRGASVATGSTNSSAAITGLSLPFPLNPPYIMEFTSTGSTIDITTGAAPVITTMRTAITQSLLDGGEQIYATPLTTMAVDIAIDNAADTNGTAGIQADEFVTALTPAASQVVSTLGFGLDSSVDIFDTPPLVDDTTDTTGEQTNVAAYRAAVEAVTAIAYEIDQQTAGGDTDSVLTELAADLADGGGIDGSAGAEINTNTLQVLEQDPATLTIPNTTQTVADVQIILVAETTTTGTSTDTTDLDTGGSIATAPEPAETNPDLDSDGVLNADDAYPNDATADTDTDGDGAPDVAYTDASRTTIDTARSDSDDDNDGWADGANSDDYPLDATLYIDPALNRDGDSILNGADNCPVTTNEDQADTDTDGTGDACSNDNDGDGIDDGSDNCPVNANPGQEDLDLDTIGDVCDTDIDGDTVANTTDVFPLDATETIDTDGDGIGNTADSDDDNDGVADGADTGTSPIDSTTACSLLRDCDGDGVFDGADFNHLDPAVTINYAPVAISDTATVSEDATVFSISVIANDTDDDGNPADDASLVLTAIGSNDTTLGAAVISGNDINYTPVAEAFGTDTFTYTVSDGTVTSTGSVTVTITSVNDAPVVGAVGPFSLAEDAANATVVGSVTATDVDNAVTGYSISAGNTGNAFAIDASGQITVADTTAINYETATSFSLTIIATDGVDDSAGVVVTVNIDDANDTAPVVGAAGPFSVAEDAVNGTVVGTVTATDADTVGSVTGYAISVGNTANAFAISAAGQITVANTTVIDYETATSFSLTIIATDGANNSTGEVVTVNINDVNDTAPVVGAAGPFSIAEDAANASVVGTVSATDADGVGAVTGYSITTGNTGTAFAISAGGQITVADTTAIDYETATSFSLTIIATDGTNDSAGVVVTVNIDDANDTAPVVGAAGPFSIAEDAANAAVVGTVTATDADTVGSVTGYSITAGNTANAFAISAGGQITVADTTAINYETATSFSLTVIATDGTNDSAGVVVTVNIDDANDTAPVVGAAGPFSIAEDAANATVVGTVTATDADTVGSVTGYSITAGNTANAFAISAGGQITVADTTAIDFETVTSFNLTIIATDGVNDSAGEVVTVNITDVNDTAPVVGAAGPFSVAEDAANASVVGTVSATDADGVGAVTDYSITAGNTGTAFAISAGGQITVANTSAINYETGTSFSLTITATDGTNTSAGEVVIVNVTDVNDTAPVVVASQSFNVIDTATNGTVVGTVSASDVDTVGSITGFTISGSVFAIDASGQITVVDNTTLAGGSPHTVSVDATDGTNLSAAVNVTITAVSNAPPVIAQTGPLSVTMDEDATPTAFVAPTITATDPESDTLTWSTTGASNGTATVTGTGASPSITYVPTADFNTSDDFVVNVNDGTSTVGITVNVTIDPVNDAPVGVADADSTSEDVPFTTINVLTNDTDIDNANNELSVSAADISSNMGGVVTNNGDGTFDYSPAAHFYGIDSFSYTVFDGTDASVSTVSVTITVIAVNDAPGAVTDNESTTVNTAFTTANVLTNDTDVEGDSLSIVAGNPTAAHGTVVNNGDGTFTYTPDTDYVGSDSFSYSVTDGSDPSVGAVNITVNPAGTPISTVTLLDSTGVDGGLGGLESTYLEPDGSIEFEYWTDAYNASAGQLVFEDLAYNYATSQYQLLTGIQEDLVLTTSGWVRFDTIDAANDGSGNLDLTLRDVSNNPIATFNLTARETALTGNIQTYLQADSELEGWANGIDPAATFSANAKTITDYRFTVTGADQYWVGEHFDCEEWNPGSLATLNGNCNAVELGISTNNWATALSQVVAGSAWTYVDDGSSTAPTGIFIAHNWANNSALYVELVSDTTTNYYVVNHNGVGSAGYVSAPVAGTAWRNATVMSQTLYEFDVPSQFTAQFPGEVTVEEGLTYFVTEQNSYVRQGQKHDLDGYEVEDNMLNVAALNDIINNHDPVKALGYNYVNLVGNTAYDLYYDSGLTSWCLDFVSVSDSTNLTLGDYGSTACDGNPASSDPATYTVDPVTGVMNIDDGVESWYSKVVGFNPTYGAKETCASLSDTGPWTCIEGDDFFGYQFTDATAAEDAMTALNNPPPAIPFADAATLAGTTQYNVFYCDDCSPQGYIMESLEFDIDGSTYTLTTIPGGTPEVGTYSVVNGILVIDEGSFQDYIQIISVDGATGANRTCWESSLANLSNCDSLGYEFFFDNQTEAQNFLDSLTFTAGATVNATTLLAGGIYEFWDDSWDGSQQVPGYWKMSVNGATIVDSDFVWSRALQKFLPETWSSTSIMLTTSGWQTGSDDIADAVITGNQATLNIRAPDNEIVQSIVITYEAMDIASREIGLFAPASMLDNVSASFSSGAQQIKESASNTQDTYQLDHWDGCTDYATWGDNCNVVWFRQMTGTTVDTNHAPATDLSFIDAAGATLELGQHNYSGGNGTSLLGIFSTSGNTISYWTVNWDAGTTAVDTGVVGTYTQSTVDGEAVIEYTVPTNIPNYDQFNLFYDYDENETGVLAVHNGYLRHGDKELSTASGTWLDLNAVAANDIFNNMPAASDVYGTWIVSGWTDLTTAPDVISFFGDGNYMHSGTCDDPSLSVVTDGLIGPEAGITGAAPELGPYTWNSTTGDFTVNPTVDANYWCGLNDTSGSNTGNATVSGDVMTVTFPDTTVVTLDRVTSDTSPIVGSWVLGDPNDPVVFTFFANGRYTEAQTCADHESGVTPEPIAGGMEYGTYTWDEGATYVLSGDVVIDTDGWCGIHDTNDAPATAAGGFTVTIDGDVMTAVIPGESDVLFYRVQ